MVKIGMLISGRYEIIEKVGTGGMADVYKAKDNRLNRFVAVKVLKQEYSADTKFVSKFRVEAQSVAGLTHPNIVTVYDVGDEDGLYYIVMELIEGITLKRYIEHKGKLDTRETLGISIQIAQGLMAAHANHIIHRDIKPHNIIISREGKVKVTDFGIAKAASSNTITSNAMGSVHYISPEQARGGFSDEKSDIYSLGITMYEMLSGVVPFTGDSTVSVALSHIQDQAPPISTFVPGIPHGIEMIVEKCIQKKPEMRYLSAEDLILDLKRATTDPDGDFVTITNVAAEGSPTIHISDEDLKDIRKGAKTVVVSQEEEDVVDLRKLDKDIEKEQGDEQDIDPKLEKVVLFGSIAAGVVLAIIVIVIIFKLFLSGGGNGDEPEATEGPTAVVETTESPDVEEDDTIGKELEDLSGLDKQSAIAYINSMDMSISIDIQEEESEDYDEGKVIETIPMAGTMLKAGDTVTIVISAGPEKVQIPDVAGYTKEEAETALKDAGFTSISFDYAYSDTVDQDKVIETQPKALSEESPNSQVVVLLSKGKEIVYYKVPKLTGLTQAKAEKELTKQKLKLGSVKSQYSDTVAAGKVISQGKDPGAEVEEGTKVSIVVSLGQEVKYTYKGSITIYDNPFTEELPSGTVKFVLNQDGTSKTVGEGEMTMTSDNFPYVLNTTGVSENEGEIIMYVNNARFMAYNISFTKVAQ